MQIRHLLGSVFALGMCSSIAFAAHWPQFRGPHGAGVADGERPPVEFGPDQGVVWKTATEPGSSSPCIWGDRIFLTAFDGEKLHTVCFDRRTGELKWRRTAPTDRIEPFFPREGSPASATPVTDGERLIVYFGSFGLLAYDLEGGELWTMPLPIPAQIGDFGSGCSPILADGLVLLNRDQLEGAKLLAVDASTGQVKWRAERPEFKSSFGTPLRWRHAGRDEVVMAGMNQMKSYELKTGRELWTVRGLPTAVCTTPVLGENLLLFAGWSPTKSDMRLPGFSVILEQADANGNGALDYGEADEQMKSMFNTYDSDRDRRITAEEWQRLLDILARGENVAFAVRPGGQGDITESHVPWRYGRGLPYVGSPLHYRKRVYFVKDGGMITCLKTTSGEVVYAQERMGALGSYYASPVAANGHIYCTSLNGTVTVVRAGDTFEVVARNEFKERMPATPAILDNRLYIRTDEHLYAFSNAR